MMGNYDKLEMSSKYVGSNKGDWDGITRYVGNVRVCIFGNQK